MKRLASLLAAALLAVACQAEPVPRTGPDFPALTGRVVDTADLLPQEDERALALASEAAQRQTGAQFVVVTVPTLQGYSIEEYGVDLGRSWGIGSRERNDGLLLIVAPAERRVRIEVGTGLEKRVTDPYAGRVIEEQILPHFRKGEMPAGIKAGSAALIERLRSKATDAEIARQDGVVT